jgi:hypothetical protein
MSTSYRVIRGIVDFIISQGRNELCLKAGIVESSADGTPITISPALSEDGQVGFVMMAPGR